MALYESMASKESKRLVDFLSLYDTYFTSANVKVYLQSRITGKMVQVDTATGVGYSYGVSSVPIHVLGARTPLWFTRGNGVGQGSLITVFKDPIYLKAMLKYIFDEEMMLPSSLAVSEENPEEEDTTTNTLADEFTTPVTLLGVYIASGNMTDREYESYVYQIKSLANTGNVTDEKIAEALGKLEERLHNQRNRKYSTVSNEQFAALAAKSVISMEQETTHYVKPEDVLDIGSIHTLFDIRIVLNNSTPYHNNDDTAIILRDCKIVSDQFDTSSLQDGILQQAYNFIFKTVSAG